MNETQVLRDESIKKVEENADAEWLEAAYEAVLKVAKRCDMFTSDDVWAEVDLPAREPRAMGAVMMKAYRNGVIQPTTYWQESRRRSAHARPLRVWAVAS